MTKRLTAVLLSLAAIAATVTTLSRRGGAMPGELAASSYPIQGIDVSHHQYAIDWPAVRAAGIKFAYLKATQGATFHDPYFVLNWRRAAAAGVVPGAYHFYSLCTPAPVQAAHFVAVMSPFARSRSLPPAVDLELGGNCAPPPPREAVLAELRTFLATVEDATGKQLVIYATRDFYEQYLHDGAITNPLWIRNLFGPPSAVIGDHPWTFWQYANLGSIPGVAGDVDRDAFRGSREEFGRLVAAGAAKRP